MRFGDIVIQFGNGTGNDRIKNLTFPVPFKKKVLNLQITSIVKGNDSGWSWQPRIWESKLDGFKASIDSPEFFWLAIGY